jgi:hypothetical protein
MATNPPQPSVVPNQNRPKTGFNRFSERLNGRVAMMAFIFVILVELVTGHGVLYWLGLT